MKRSILFFLALVFSWSLSAQSSSPQVVAPAGDSFEGETVRIDWTIGEPVITSIQSSERQITQGFHQPYLTITSVQDLPAEIGKIQVFPNPSADLVQIKMRFDQDREVRLQLLDVRGQIIWSQIVNGQQLEESTNIQSLPNGLYFLNILLDDKQYSQSFKIQKIK